MIDLEESIDFSRLIMLEDYNNLIFSEYNKTFFVATECIREYLERESFNKSRALTVLASGDQIFNLLHEGVEKIDAFDINKLQYFIYYLKRAFLLRFPLDTFVILCNSIGSNYALEEKIKIIEMLKEYLPEDVYEYFRRILEYAKNKKDAKISNLIIPNSIDIEKSNNYLKSEEDYLKVRKSLMNTDVNLYFDNALNIPSIVKPGYDVILLSNIADYLCQMIKGFDIWDFKKYIDSFVKMLNNNGLLINYLFGLDTASVILGTSISRSDLPDNSISKIETYPFSRNQGYYRVKKRS